MKKSTIFAKTALAILAATVSVMTLFSCTVTKTVDADEAENCINSLKQNAKIIVTGELSNNHLYFITEAIKYSKYKIGLDLSKSTGLTEIGDGRFEFCTGLTSITIPDSVTEIGNGAFGDCIALKSITIPNRVREIRHLAFRGCSGLEKITVSEGNKVYDSRNSCNAIIRSKDNTLLIGCKNTVIPNDVMEIGNGAFSGCTALKSVTIPNSVTEIGNSAFSGCTGLEKITVSESNKVYNSRNSCNAIIRNKDNTLIFGCKNTVIPNGVTQIGDSAFYKCTELKSITIPNTVTKIGNSAFSGCTALKSITIPDSVTEIGTFGFVNSFEDCTGLEKITVSEGNKVYNSHNNCNAIIRNKDNTLIFGCKNTVIPNGVTQIGDSAFYKCTELKNITIPNTVTKILERSFCNCTGLTDITISENVTYIGGNSFQNCTGLTNVTIPDSVTKIEGCAFYGCTGLTSITIPDSVTYIGDQAFSDCENLKNINASYRIKKMVLAAMANDY